MSTPAAKRRKTTSSGVLFKPFKSPMKDQVTGLTETQTIAQANLPSKGQNTSQSFVAKLGECKPKEQHQQTDEAFRLRREEMSVLSQISRLKVELGQVKQALSIEELEKEKELMDLVSLWRGVSQQAAEEVFAIFRDKVNAMGGLKKWTEMEKERKESNAFSMWEFEKGGEERATGGEDDEDPEECEEKPCLEAPEEAKVDEAMTCSIDVMLRYLDIKPHIIGYDVENQRWLV